jgi:hypothetical protein
MREKVNGLSKDMTYFFVVLAVYFSPHKLQYLPEKTLPQFLQVVASCIESVLVTYSAAVFPRCIFFRY